MESATEEAGMVDRRWRSRLRTGRFVGALAVVTTVLGLSNSSFATSIPDTATRYSYDSAGRLKSIVGVDVDAPAGAGPEAAVFHWDPVGNLTSLDRTDASLTSITGLVPESGAVGDKVTISGTAFSSNAADNVVEFNGVRADVSSASVTELVVHVPDGAVDGAVSVVSP